MLARAGRKPVVIVGASLAGASAAEALRRAGYAEHIVMLGAEPELPYERPPLSKGYLLGTTAEERLFPWSAAFYAEQGVELRPGAAAVALDPPAREVALASGERVPFAQLLIATGSAVHRLALPGADLPGIHYLRTLADARALAEALRAAEHGGRVVVVGAGFIGAEVAATCRQRGLDVTLLEALPVPLARTLGAEVGSVLAELHRAHDVDLRLGEGVAEFRGAARVEEVRTTSGARIPCACVVVGVGVRPADGWLRGSGLALEDGVRVNEFCETSVPGVFAAGDVARWPHHLAGATQPEHVRLEHWDNALRQGEAAARNLLGAAVPYAPVPYFWSDQYDRTLQYVGYAREWDQLVWRGDPAGAAFTAIYLAEGRVRAALAVNRVREVAALKMLIGQSPDAAALADESTDLKTLVAAARRE